MRKHYKKKKKLSCPIHVEYLLYQKDNSISADRLKCCCDSHGQKQTVLQKMCGKKY